MGQHQGAHYNKRSSDRTGTMKRHEQTRLQQDIAVQLHRSQLSGDFATVPKKWRWLLSTEAEYAEKRMPKPRYLPTESKISLEAYHHCWIQGLIWSKCI
jgi:hypothetical protein